MRGFCQIGAPPQARILISSAYAAGFRLNEGNVKVHTMDRLAALIGKTPGNRITYQELIGKAETVE